jgi:type IV pilus assembly protein PilQ
MMPMYLVFGALPVAGQGVGDDRPTRAPDSARISVTFQGTPIEDVAATFAEFGGVSVVLGREVSGPVTAVLDDVPWRSALQAVLDTQGLSGRWITDDILAIARVQTGALEEDEARLATRVFRIRYQKASELADAVAGALSERGTLGVAEHSNALVVTDTPDVLRRIQSLLWGGLG